MIRVGLESILGLTERHGSAFVLAPAIPDGWPGFKVERRLADGTVYEFRVTHEGEPAEVVVSATLDGAPLAPLDGRLVVPIARDGLRHVVDARLGARA
jgi:cyclic beta-1,2-glucan synthetase